jgi:hypothetical protein
MEQVVAAFARMWLCVRSGQRNYLAASADRKSVLAALFVPVVTVSYHLTER